MLRSLFRGLTAEPDRGAAVFEAVTAEARLPHWYVEGRVPDTLDGRFAVLATLTALTLVRFEQAVLEAGERWDPTTFEHDERPSDYAHPKELEDNGGHG